jgi:ABC-type uncharacterized transport system auxiliary subunit
MKKLIILLALTLCLSGCSVKQEPAETHISLGGKGGTADHPAGQPGKSFATVEEAIAASGGGK